LEERIKSITSTIKPDFKRISDIIEDNIILNYFLDNLKKEVIKEKVDFTDLRNIISADYYLKFNKKDKKEIIHLLNKQDSNVLIDYCTLGLTKKEKKGYNKRPKVFDSLLKYYNNMNVEILSTSYMQLLKHNETKNLIKQSYNIKDLKAIIFMDILLPFLDESYSKQIINSNINPEQKALEFAKSYLVCKDIKKIKGIFLDQYQISEEEIYFLYDIKKNILTNLKVPVYTKNKEFLDRHKSCLNDLNNLFNEKAKKGMEIIKKNMFNLEKKYNLNDNGKGGYFTSFIRKKKFESFQRELLEYHNNFNKIKEIIQT
jgi:hypothetical protein